MCRLLDIIYCQAQQRKIDHIQLRLLIERTHEVGGLEFPSNSAEAMRTCQVAPYFLISIPWSELFANSIRKRKAEHDPFKTCNLKIFILFILRTG